MRKFSRLAAAALMTAVVTFYILHDAAPTAHAPSHVAAPFPFPARDQPSPSAPASATIDPYAGLTDRLANPLENAAALRPFFERYQGSANPLDRWFAARAWSACFPLFLAPANGAASFDNVTRALPADAPNHAERLDAYRALMGRCRSFLDLPRATLAAHSEQINGATQSGALLSPGERARSLYAHGQSAQAAGIAQVIVASGDAYAIGSLRDYAFQVLTQRADAGAAQGGVRPDLGALAVSIAGCDMGLACGAASLTALQACASNGLCSGDLRQRLLQELSEAERTAVLLQSATLVAALRARDFAALEWLRADGR